MEAWPTAGLLCALWSELFFSSLLAWLHISLRLRTQGIRKGGMLSSLEPPFSDSVSLHEAPQFPLQSSGMLTEAKQTQLYTQLMWHPSVDTPHGGQFFLE